MRRGMLMLMALAAVVMIGTGAADARKSIATTITHDGSVARSGGLFVDYGRVGSKSPRCRALREVRLVGQSWDGTRTALDVDLTSFFGAWATLADYSAYVRVRAKATKFRYRSGRHQAKICKRAVVAWPVTSG